MRIIFGLLTLLVLATPSGAADLTYNDDLAPGYLECVKHGASMAEKRTCLWEAVTYWQKEIDEESGKLLNSITVPESKKKLKEMMDNWKTYLQNMTDMAARSADGNSGSEFAALTNINISRKHFQFLKQLWESDLVRKYE